MNKVRVGLIGAGKVARDRHLPKLGAIADVELTLVWSRDPDKADRAASDFGFDKSVADWREIVESQEVDAVVIATPPVLHHQATLAALDAGKHVLCQARMARNLREAQEMTQAARDSSLVTALYPPLPGLKGDRTVQRLLHEEDYVGAIRDVRVAGMAFTERPGGYSGQADPEVVGVNAMTLGMWAEVLNRWVGPTKTVAARGKPHHPERMVAGGGVAEAVVPDSLAIAAELECGAIASYHFSSEAAFAPDQAIEIYGSRGAIVYTLFGDDIRGATRGGDELRPIEVPARDVRAQTTDAEFIRAIREGTPVHPDFEEGLRYMEFSEAVAISLLTGTVVSMPPEPRMDSWGRVLE